MADGMSAPQIAPEEVLGHLDHATTGAVHGWAWSKTNPTARRRLNLFIDDVLVDRVVACHYRQDLKDAQIGDGFYAFEVLFPRGRFKPGAKVRLVDATTGTELVNSPAELAA